MGYKKSDFENFQSDWLSKDDIQDAGGSLVATIDRVDGEDIKDIQSGKNKRLPVLHFKEELKPFILSANVNWDTVEQAYGPDTDEWSGKKLEFFFDPNVSFGGKRTGGVRIRIQTSTKLNGSTGGKPKSPVLESWSDAVRYCKDKGVSEEELKAEFKKLGMTKWTAAGPLVVVDLCERINAPLTEEEIPL